MITYRDGFDLKLLVFKYFVIPVKTVKIVKNPLFFITPSIMQLSDLFVI